MLNQNKITTTVATSAQLKNLRNIKIEKNISENSEKQKYKIPIIKKIVYKYLSSKNKNFANPINISNLKRILIFRYDLLGDYIITTPIISFLRKNFPNLIIDVFASNRNENLAKSDANINNVYVMDFKKTNSKTSKNSIKLMKKNHYDLVFILIYTKNTKAANLAYKIAPSAHKIGFSLPNRKNLYSLIFDTVITYKHWKFLHSELIFQSIKKIFGEQNSIENYPHYVPLEQKFINNAMNFAEKNHLEYSTCLDNVVLKCNEIATVNALKTTVRKIVGKKYVVINLTGSAKNRSINKENSLKIVEYLVKKYPEIHFFITGDLSKKDFILEIVTIIATKNCSELFETFLDYIAILIGACLLISPDTAPIHIAAAAKIPIVGIYFEYKIFDWHPYSNEFTLVFGYYFDVNTSTVSDLEDINLIDFDKVIEAAESYLIKL